MNTYKKVVVPHILHILLLFSLLGTMFISNTVYHYSYTSYKNYYYYGYSYKIPYENSGYSHYNFFESVYTDVLPGIFGTLVFILMFALLILSIVALTSKKASAIGIIACIVPFFINANYVAYMISIEEASSHYLDGGAYILFIPLALMIITSICGIVFTAKRMKENKLIDSSAVNGAQNFAYSAPLSPAAAPAIDPNGKKFCTSCGNECVAQAVICTKCGAQF